MNWGNISQKMGPALPIAGNNVFGRMMTFFSNQNGQDVPQGFCHFWVFDIKGKSAVAGNVDINLGGWTAIRGFNYQWHLESGLHEAGSVGGPWKAGSWDCLQWQLDASNREAILWVNGRRVIDMKNWDMATPWTTFSIGLSALEPLSKPTELWVDDFALGESMIDCPSMP
jgi:hypothetical protein